MNIIICKLKHNGLCFIPLEQLLLNRLIMENIGEDVEQVNLYTANGCVKC